MALSARQFDFQNLLHKFKEDNLPSMEIVRFANHYKENCVLVLYELRAKS